MLLPAWAAFLGTFVLAALSYRFVELPIRRAAAKWRATARPKPDRAALAIGPGVIDDRGVIKPSVVGQAPGSAAAPTNIRRDIDPA